MILKKELKKEETDEALIKRVYEISKLPREKQYDHMGWETKKMLSDPRYSRTKAAQILAAMKYGENITLEQLIDAYREVGDVPLSKKSKPLEYYREKSMQYYAEHKKKQGTTK